MNRLLAAVVLLIGTGLGQTTDSITLASGGIAQANRAVSIPRFFVKGEIAQYAQAVVGGTPVLTQVDVKNRWSDGSLKFAIISFVAPSISSTPVSVTFQNQTTGNNTGYLAPADILGPNYNFEEQIQLGGSFPSAISARTMLSAAQSCGAITDFTQKCRYWLQGPIVTAVILEDRAGRSFDVNTDGGVGTPLHPIFEAWCYPSSGNCEVGATLENMWASSNGNNSARNQTYSLVITSGQSSPVTQLSQASFTQFGYTRWRRAYWTQGAPVSLVINWNPAYLESTTAYPVWDTNGAPTPAQIAAQQACYQKALSIGRFAIPGIDNAAGGDTCGTSASGGIGNYGESQGSANSDNWLGPSTAWNYMAFMSGDPTLFQMMTDNADLAGRWPMWIREADSGAGSGGWFDKPLTGSVNTQGRFVSINARQQSTLNPTDWTGATNQQAISDEGCSGMTLDSIHWQSTSALSFGHWVTQDMSHMPEYSYLPYTLTGKYYYLEQLQSQAAFELGYRSGCKGGNYFRQGELGLFINRVRDTGWYLRTLAYAAFISPDGWPEGPYFQDKLGNELALLEGENQIPQTVNGTADNTASYNFGLNTSQTSLKALPLPAPLNPWTYSVEGHSSNGYAGYWGNGAAPNVTSAMSRFQEDIATFGVGIVGQLGLFDTTELLTYMAKRPLHEVLDPTFNRYLIGTYTYPVANANQYIPDWATFQSLYAASPTQWGTLPKGILGNSTSCAAAPCPMSSSTFGYMFMSFPFFSNLTVDGLSGATAYSTMYALMPQIGTAMGADFIHGNQYNLTPSAGAPPPPPPPPVLSSIAVTPASPSLVLGSTVQLTATGTYSDGSTQNLTAASTWTSANTAVATVSGGLVTATGAGSDSITATDGSISGADTVSVTVPCRTLATTAGPANVHIAGGPGFTSLSWNTITGATSYNVYRSTVSGCYQMPLSNVPAAVYSDNAVQNGTTYYYVVTGVIGGVETGPATEVSFAPSNTATLPAGVGWHSLGSATAPSSVSPNYGGQSKGVYYWNPMAQAQEYTDFYENAITGASVAYSSAIWDSKRDRLVLWGGGHNDGDDPEVYTVNLKGQQPSASRIVDPNWTVHNPDVPFDCACKGQFNCGKGMWSNGPGPTSPYYMTEPAPWETWFEYLPAPEGEPVGYSNPPQNTPSCGYPASRLTPNTRHTYAILDYDPVRDYLWSFGGTPSSGNGFYSSVTWTLNLANNSWARTKQIGPKAGGWSPPTAYDSITGHFWLYDQSYTFYEYDPVADVYTPRTNNAYGGYNAAMAFDSVDNRLLVVAYDRIGFLDLNQIVAGNPAASNAALVSIAATPACAAAKDSTAGVTYDSKRGVFEVFSGGVHTVGQPAYNITYVNLQPTSVTLTYKGAPLVVASQSCAQVTYGTTQGTDYPPNDVTRAGSGGAGPSGRFRYVPDLDVIFYIPHPNQPAWILRLE